MLLTDSIAFLTGQKANHFLSEFGQRDQQPNRQGKQQQDNDGGDEWMFDNQIEDKYGYAVLRGTDNSGLS